MVAAGHDAYLVDWGAPDGAELYKRSCAQCHDGGLNRAPARDAFRNMNPDRVLAAMESGSMVTMANYRTAAERRAIAGLRKPLCRRPSAGLLRR